jgi:hypothetical protein
MYIKIYLILLNLILVNGIIKFSTLVLFKKCLFKKINDNFNNYLLELQNNIVKLKDDNDDNMILMITNVL